MTTNISFNTSIVNEIKNVPAEISKKCRAWSQNTTIQSNLVGAAILGLLFDPFRAVALSAIFLNRAVNQVGDIGSLTNDFTKLDGVETKKQVLFKTASAISHLVRVAGIIAFSTPLIVTSSVIGLAANAFRTIDLRFKQRHLTIEEKREANDYLANACINAVPIVLVIPGASPIALPLIISAIFLKFTGLHESLTI